MRMLAMLVLSVTVYKSATCGCCAKWVERMRAAGFTVDTVNVASQGALDVIKRDHGITARLASCHTAVVGGYVVEGHVPPEDIQRLVREHPAGIAGLAVPGMPSSAPGMDAPTGEHYDVLALQKDGSTSVYDHR